MNPYLQACIPDQRLAKSTLLAMLDSNLDESKVLVVSSGNILDISQIEQTEINSRIKDGTWVFYENRLPRRLLIGNQNWRIVSFNPKSRLVCVQIFAKSGMRMLNFTLPQLSPMF